MSPFEKQQQEESPPTTGGEKVELKASRSMCYYCFDVLIHALRFGQQIVDNQRKQTVPDFVSGLPDITVECPIFVTWDKMHQRSNKYQLRGCIGTLGPRLLVDAVGEYALTSALKDRRFRPITLDEIPSLRVAVSLLVNYEKCEDCYDWTVGVHGIMIKFMVNGRHYSATYLPEVAKEQGWTIPQAVASLMQKAGYQGNITPDIVRNIQCTRYQSSKIRVSFEEYVKEHCQGQDPMLSTAVPMDVGSKAWQSCKTM
mmetsp:Transcript_79972/g.232192  ORF Transcript_79972/g.232192 Transcript_79972/m.232192 type:complete len:256 (+) Transcript_79972:135-902(+)